MEYYKALKNEDVINAVGKSIVLENIILRNVSLPQNDLHGMYSLIIEYLS